MTDPERDGATPLDPPTGGVRDLTPPTGQPRAPTPPDTEPVLDTFKGTPADADSTRVNDAIGARPRLNWNPVTDSGGDAPPKSDRDHESGFAFNLGNALSKLGIDAEGHPRERSHDPLAALRSTFGVGSDEPAAAPVADAQAPAAPAEPAPAEPAPPTLERRQKPASPPPGEPTPPLEVRVRPSVQPEPTPPARDPIPDAPLPRRSAPSQPDLGAQAPQPAPAAAAPAPAPPAPAPASERRVDPDELDTGPRPYVAPRRSVFDDVVAPSPTLPPTVVAPSTPRSVTPTTAQPIAPPVAHVAGAPAAAAASAPSAPSAPTAPVTMGTPILPTLPAAPAASPIPMVAVAHDAFDSSQATQADLRALRSAQLRAGRQARRGHVLGRTLLVLIVLGGLVGAGFAFGRDFLFPVEWDPALTPVVDEIQADRGTDFLHTVGLVVQPDEDFALTVTQLTIGDTWIGRVPEWRALGLVAGDPTVAGIAADVAGDRLAVYDPATDRVYMPESADPALAIADLRVALEQAFDAQLGESPVTPAPASSLAGVSASDVIAQRAVDTYLARRDAGNPAGGRPVSPTANLPLPIEYELVAGETFGETILRAAGAEPETATFATDVSDVVGTILDDRPVMAEAAPVQLGERGLAEPVALGVDDWSLVWGARLPAGTVDELVGLVVADSYHPIDRSGTTCVAGVFQTANADQATVLLAAMTQWVAASPAGAQATATALADTRVQLVACDPGPEAAVASAPAAVRALVDRQLVRLAG